MPESPDGVCEIEEIATGGWLLADCADIIMDFRNLIQESDIYKIFYAIAFLEAVALRRMDRLSFFEYSECAAFCGDGSFSTNITLLPEFLTVQKKYYEFQKLESSQDPSMVKSPNGDKP